MVGGHEADDGLSPYWFSVLAMWLKFKVNTVPDQVKLAFVIFDIRAL